MKLEESPAWKWPFIMMDIKDTKKLVEQVEKYQLV